MRSVSSVAGKVRDILAGKLHSHAQEPPTALAVGLPAAAAEWMPPGWRLLAAAGAEQACDLLRTHEVAVVLCDRDMPDFVWKEMLPRFAGAPSRPCVVLVSGSQTDQLWEQVTVSGGYDVLPKPVRAEEFRRVVQAAVSHWRSGRQLREMRHVPDRR